MRPLLLLDVDGPLNPYMAKPTRRPAGFGTHRIRPTDWREYKPLRVWLNEGHGPLLTAFAEQHSMDLVWATTWEHDANTMIGPKIGLPELPVIEWGFAAHHWKFDAVLDYANGRPLAWFDDDFGHFPTERAWFEQNRADTPTLLHHVDPAKGILADDFDVVAEWVTALRANTAA